MATQDKNFIVKNGLTVEGSTIISPAATTSFASLRIPHGTAPSSPNNGDIWSTSAGVFARVNGVTVGPLGTGGGGGVSYSFSSNPPVSPNAGDIWIDSDTGVEYTYVNDGSVPVWADMSSGNYVGPTGATGATGPTGSTGATGAAGKTLLNGTSDPTTQGVDGDFYINTSNNKIFGPKNLGLWPAGVSIVGPQGATGPTGPRNITILAPSASEDMSLFYTTNALTISKIAHVIRGGTSVTFTIRYASTRSAAGTEVITGGTVANSTTGATITSFSSATISAGSWVWLTTSAVSGTVNELAVTLEF